MAGMKSKSAMSRFFSFMADVRREIDKITWPAKKEVVITTIVVFVLAVIASIFFSLVDTAADKLVHFIIGR
jgi:preprotein translocase subunit SecE